MLLGFLILLTCQLAGELLVLLFGLPIPGPVAGMLLLFTGLMFYGEVPDSLRLPAEGLIRHLALLFVPGRPDSPPGTAVCTRRRRPDSASGTGTAGMAGDSHDTDQQHPDHPVLYRLRLSAADAETSGDIQ